MSHHVNGVKRLLLEIGQQKPQIPPSQNNISNMKLVCLSFSHCIKNMYQLDSILSSVLFVYAAKNIQQLALYAQTVRHLSDFTVSEVHFSLWVWCCVIARSSRGEVYFETLYLGRVFYRIGIQSNSIKLLSNTHRVKQFHVLKCVKKSTQTRTFLWEVHRIYNLKPKIYQL